MTNAPFPSLIGSGDVFTWPLTFTNPDGTAFNLTGVVIGCTVKANITDPDSAALFSKDIAGDPTGVISFQLGPFGAGVFFLDVKWWNTGQANARQTVIGNTRFVVQQSVTQRLTPVLAHA